MADGTQQKGTGFVNLQKYLQANTGSQLGQNIGQRIGQETQQAQQQLGQQQQQFQQQATAGQLGNQQDTEQRQRILGQVDTGAGGPSDEDTKAFERYRSGTYTGPQGLGDVSATQSKARDVEGVGKALGSQAGRFGVLQRYLGGGKQYSGGQQNLDAMLLGQGGGQQQLAQAQRGTIGLEGNVNRAQQTAQQQAQTYGGQAQAFGQETQQQLAQRQQAEQQQLQQQQQQAAQQQGQAYQQQFGQLQQNQVNSQLAQQLGLQQGQSLYDLNLAQFAQQGQAPTLSSVANQGDLARANALAQLSGQQQSLLNQGEVGTYDPSKALQFNTPQFQEALQSRQGVLSRATQQRQADIMNNPNSGEGDYMLRMLSPTGGDYNRLKQSGLTPQQLIQGLKTSDPNVMKYISSGLMMNPQGALTGSSWADIGNKLDAQMQSYLNAAQGQAAQGLGYTQTANILPGQGQ